MKLFARIGEISLGVLEEIGGIFLMFWTIVVSFFPPRFDGRETWRNLYKVGVKSYPIVILTAVLVGAISVVQGAHFVHKTGATGVVPYVAGHGIFAELGPVLIGLMFSGRVGAFNTAELGTMKVTEQVDALRALAIDPIRYLVAPRFVSMVIMLLLLTVLGDTFALIGAAYTGELIIDLPARQFFYGILQYHMLNEFLVGLLKGTTFGMCISVVSCHFGLAVRGGAVGVGKAVNASVVASAVGIFTVDFIVTRIVTAFGLM